jgi:hypothetical protein
MPPQVLRERSNQADTLVSYCVIAVGILVGLGCVHHVNREQQRETSPGVSGNDIHSLHARLLDLEGEILELAGRLRIEPEAECHLLAIGVESDGETCSYIAYAPSAEHADSLVHLVEHYNERYLEYRDRIEGFLISDPSIFDPCFGVAPPERPEVRIQSQRCVTVPYLEPPLHKWLRQTNG